MTNECNIFLYFEYLQETGVYYIFLTASVIRGFNKWIYFQIRLSQELGLDNQSQAMGVLKTQTSDPRKTQTFGCLENSDSSKTQTPGCLKNSDPRKTQTLGCLENSDPRKFQTTGCLENSDPRKTLLIVYFNNGSARNFYTFKWFS